MKLLLLLFFVTFLNGRSLFSQPTITLSKTFGTTGTESIRDLIADRDGHFIALGMCDSVDRDTSCHYHGGASDIWLVKMNADGNILWQKCYGGSDEEDAYQIIQTPDSGFLFTGWSFSQDGDVTVYNGSFFTWLVKIDSNGNIQWQQGLSGGQPYHLMQLHDGRYLVTCYTVNTTTDFPIHYGGGFNQDAWIFFLSENGVKDTAIQYGGSDDDYLTEVIELPNGDLQMFGYTESNDYDLAGTTAYGFQDGWILKTDSDGVIKWQTRWGGASSDFINGAVLLANKEFLTVGSTSSNGIGEFSSNHGQSDVWVIRLDSTGNVLSNYLYGGSGDEGMDWRLRIHRAASGHFVIGSWTNSFVSGDIDAHFGFTDYWFLTIDSAGTLLNSKVSGGSNDDKMYSNEMSTNNVATQAGITLSNDFDVQDYHGNGDGWFVKIGNFTIVGDIKNQKNLITVFPNPLHEQFVITSTNGEMLKNAWLEIYETTGTPLLSKKIHQNAQSICVQGLSAGTYLYTLRDKRQNIIATGKLIIQ